MAHRPNFINIGPGRSGSSWLYQALSAHPDICMGVSKETEYFNVHFDKGPDWYEAFFSNCHGARAIGEISNNYYLDPQIAGRIKNYNPDIKLIINLRNPFDLLYSIYQFGLRRGLPLESLEKALDWPIGMFMGSGFQLRVKRESLTATDQVPLLDGVLLWDRIQPFLDHFQDDEIYFFVFDRLKWEPRVLLGEVYQFLAVDPDFLPPMVEQVVNQAIVPRMRWIGPLAKNVGFLLRRLGLYRMLQALHRSDRLKSLFFKAPTQRPSRIRELIPQVAIKRIEEDMDKLIQAIPVLAEHWNGDRKRSGQP